MEIKKDGNRFYTEIDGRIAEVEFTQHDGGLDIIHTRVPKALEGQGIAGELVKHTYNYAEKEGLKPLATCPYAVAWLKRHGEK